MMPRRAALIVSGAWWLLGAALIAAASDDDVSIIAGACCALYGVASLAFTGPARAAGLEATSLLWRRERAWRGLVAADEQVRASIEAEHRAEMAKLEAHERDYEGARESETAARTDEAVRVAAAREEEAAVASPDFARARTERDAAASALAASERAIAGRDAERVRRAGAAEERAKGIKALERDATKVREEAELLAGPQGRAYYDRRASDLATLLLAELSVDPARSGTLEARAKTEARLAEEERASASADAATAATLARLGAKRKSLADAREDLARSERALEREQARIRELAAGAQERIRAASELELEATGFTARRDALEVEVRALGRRLEDRERELSLRRRAGG